MQDRVVCKQRNKVMKIMLLGSVILSGCAVNQPLGYDSPAVSSVCGSDDGETVAVTYRQQEKHITLNLVSSLEALYDICGKSTGACVDLTTNVIHMIDDRSCEKYASHELAHVFGVAGIDTYGEIMHRRTAFYSR